MKKLIIILSVLFILIAVLLGYAYFSLTKPITDSDHILKIYPQEKYSEVVSKLNNQLPDFNQSIFDLLANQMNYNDQTIKSGLYKIQSEINTIELIKKLRSGDQTEVNVILHNEQNMRQVAGKISQYLALDSVAFIESFYSPQFQEENEIDSIEFMSLIIPNTYRMWWNTDPTEFVERMKKEHKKFWEQSGRLAKAAKLDLTPTEVYTLASIVEKESQYKPERDMIAGVYLNRLKKNIALQADPTVLFALGDFERFRVLKQDLLYDSPYNTYIYPGLPPGPIGLASISSIDAVLNAEEHDYYYFCAKPGNSGQHVFAKTLNAHLVNARKFQQWLNQQRIYR